MLTVLSKNMRGNTTFCILFFCFVGCNTVERSICLWEKDYSSLYTLYVGSHNTLNELCRTTNYCLSLAAEQEKTIMEKWLPELKTGILNAQNSLEDCRYVAGLVSDCPSIPFRASLCYFSNQHVQLLSTVAYSKFSKQKKVKEVSLI